MIVSEDHSPFGIAPRASASRTARVAVQPDKMPARRKPCAADIPEPVEIRAVHHRRTYGFRAKSVQTRATPAGLIRP